MPDTKRVLCHREVIAELGHAQLFLAKRRQCSTYSSMNNHIADATWAQLLPLVRERCPRITATDFEDCGQRIDLLSAKVQNRHWCDRITARRLVLELLQQCGEPIA